MYSLDWDAFTADITWLVTEDDKIEVSPPQMAYDGPFQPTAAFVETFPILSQLLNLARVTKVRINGQLSHLYGRGRANTASSRPGYLARFQRLHAHSG